VGEKGYDSEGGGGRLSHFDCTKRGKKGDIQLPGYRFRGRKSLSFSRAKKVRVVGKTGVGQGKTGIKKKIQKHRT